MPNLTVQQHDRRQKSLGLESGNSGFEPQLCQVLVHDSRLVLNFPNLCTDNIIGLPDSCDS